MGRPLQITINSIRNGKQAFEDFPGDGQFLFSRGIDPDIVANFDEDRPSSGGIITPVPVANQVTVTISDPIISMMLPSTESIPKLYVLTDGGKLVVFTIFPDTLTSQTTIGTVTGSQAHGGTYYNDFIYILGSGTSGGDDVSRFGPFTGTPTLTNGFWKTTLGLTDLDGDINTLQVGSVEYPTHWGHVHTDNALYFADVTGRQAILNKIKTDDAGADDGSAYNVLDLPFDFQISDIESYGLDLVMSANKYNDVGNSPGRSGNPALFFWDTFADTFYKRVDLPEFAIVSAIMNKGGRIYVFGGSVSRNGDAQTGGSIIGLYDGADGVDIIKSIADSHPPFPGAVASTNERIVWGGKVTQDLNRPAALSIGSKSESIPKNSINCIAESSQVALIEDNAIMTSLIYPFRDSGLVPRITTSSFSQAASVDVLDSTATQTSIMQFGLYNIGEPFRITKIRIPLAEAVASGVTITPTLLFDDRQTSYELKAINNTNFSGKKNIVYKEPEITNTKSNVQAKGEHDFILQLAFTGTVPTSVKFPITIELETLDD